MEGDETVVNKSSEELSGDQEQVMQTEEKMSPGGEKKSDLFSTWSPSRDTNIKPYTKLMLSPKECQLLQNKVKASAEKTNPSRNDHKEVVDPEKKDTKMNTPSPTKILLKPSKLDFVLSPSAAIHSDSSSSAGTNQISFPDDICKLQADDATLIGNAKSTIIKGPIPITEISDHTPVSKAPEKLKTFRERYAASQKNEKAQSNKADTIVMEMKKTSSGHSAEKMEDLSKGCATVYPCLENGVTGSEQHREKISITQPFSDLIVQPKSLEQETEYTKQDAATIINENEESSQMRFYDGNTCCSQNGSSIPDYSLYCSNFNEQGVVREDDGAPNSDGLCTSSLNNMSLSTSSKSSSFNDVNRGLPPMLSQDNSCSKNESFLSGSSLHSLGENSLFSKREVNQLSNFEDPRPSSPNNSSISTSYKPHSVTDTNQDCIEMVLHTLNKLRISQVVGKTFDEVLSAEDISGLSNPVFRTNIKLGLKTIWTQVKMLESLLEKNICLPNDQMSIRLNLLQEAKNSIPKNLPEQIYNSFMDIFDRFAAEYKNRNQEIQILESRLMGSLMDKAVQYYSEEMQFVLGDTFVDAKAFHSIRQQIHEETERIFLEAAGLQLIAWQIKYKTELDSGLSHETVKFEKQNEAKKEAIEKLSGIVKDCVQKYEAFMEEGKKVREYTPRQRTALETYNNVSLEAHMKTFEYFNKLADTLECDKKVISFYADDLDKELAQHLASKLNEIEVIQNELTEAAQKYDQYQFGGKPDDSKASTSGWPSWPEVHDQDMHSGSFPDECLSNVIPRRDLVVHFGCERTLAGIVLPDTGDIDVLYEVKNCVNFGRYQLHVFPVEYESVSRLVIPNLIDRKNPAAYESFSYKYYKAFKLEELIACLLLSLKWSVELEQQVEIVSCTISVPQSFNYCHRKVIEDAARIARLENVSFINDTQAIALAFMIKEEWRNASVVVVNTSEGFIDSAYFKLDNGLLACQGVTGDYLQETGHLGKRLGKRIHKLVDEESYVKQKVENLLEEFLSRLWSSEDLNKSACCVIVCGSDNTNIMRFTVDTLNKQLWGSKIAVRVQDHQYPLMGAGYRTGLDASKPNHAFFKRWINLCGGDLSFLSILLSQITDQVSKDKQLSKCSKLSRANLRNNDLWWIDNQFVLRERQHLQTLKLDVLKKMVYLQKCVQNADKLGDSKAGIILRCRVIRSYLQMDSTREQLNRYLNELDATFTKHFPEFF